MNFTIPKKYRIEIDGLRAIAVISVVIFHFGYAPNGFLGVGKGYDPDYKIFSTHPVYEERFTIINSLKSKEEYDFDQIIESRFNFIKAKLFGFTENNTNSLNKYLEGDYLNYAKSIILSKKGKLKESMILLREPETEVVKLDD